MVQAKKTAAYRVIAGPGGKRVFRFYCDISGELCCVTKAPFGRIRRTRHWRSRGRRRGGGPLTDAPNAAGMCPPPCSTSTRSGVWTAPPGQERIPCVLPPLHGIRLKDPDAFFCPACGARLLVGGTEEEEGRTE